MAINKHTENYGRGVVALDENRDAIVSLEREIRERFAAPSYKPPMLPRVALQLQELYQKGVDDLQRITELIESDPMVAGQLVKKARSPAYGATPVSSLREAVMRIGLGGVRDVVWEIVLSMKIFRAEQYMNPMESIRKHVALAAKLARIIAARAKVPAQDAFLCGLLHDVGLSAALMCIAETPRRSLPNDEVLGAALAECHAEVSAVIAKLWQLPASVQEVLAAHHELTIGDKVHPLPAIVYLAHDIAAQLGAAVRIGSVLRTDASDAVLVEKAFLALGLTEIQLRQIGEEAKRAAAAAI